HTRGAADAVGVAGAVGAARVAGGVAHVRAAAVRRRRAARPVAVAAFGVIDRRRGAGLRAADRARGVQSTRAGAVAEAVAPAAGRAGVGTVVARISADRNARARADAARDRARLTGAGAVGTTADTVEAETALAVQAGTAVAAGFRQRELSARRSAAAAA